MAVAKDQTPSVPCKSETLANFYPKFHEDDSFDSLLAFGSPINIKTTHFPCPVLLTFLSPSGSSPWAKSLPWDVPAPRDRRTPTLRKWRRCPSAPASPAPAGAAGEQRPRRPRRPRWPRRPPGAAKGRRRTRKKPPNGGEVSRGSLFLGDVNIFARASVV